MGDGKVRITARRGCTRILILENRNVELVRHVFEIIVDVKDFNTEKYTHRDV